MTKRRPVCPPPLQQCGGGLSGHHPHGPHIYRWRRTTISTDATGQTTPYRHCPGITAPLPDALAPTVCSQWWVGT